MRELLAFVITGVVTGSLYGLTGVGLVLTYRTSGVFNFGHGAIAAGAAFLFFTLHTTHHVPWPLAALITIVVLGVAVGYVLERVAAGLAEASQVLLVVATVGILLGVQGYLLLQYGDVTRTFPPVLPVSGFSVAGVNVTWTQVINILVASLAAGGLYLFLRRARLGVAMRALVDNPTLVGLSGQRARRIRLAAWIIGSSFAALSGILLAPTLELDVTLLTLLIVQAFGACAIGLFESLPLTYAGGIAIGVLASLATRYFTHEPWNGIPLTMPFLVLVAVLILVPARKFPKQRLAPRLPVRDVVSSARRPLTVAAAVVGGVLLLVLPHVVGTKLPVWISGLTYVVVFASLALLVWTSGQISLCHAAFAALGATTMAHLTHAHVPWLLALVLAGLLTAPIGAVVAIPAIRVSGIYLALATFGFGILMQDVVFRTSIMFGSHLSVAQRRPVIGFINGRHDVWLYYIVLAVAVGACGVLVAIHRGRTGRLLRALAESPTMLSTHGLEVNITRLIVFCVSAALAGVAGALMVTQFGSVGAVAFGPLNSLILVVVLGICGTRLLRSSILAAALYVVVPGYITSFGVDRQYLVFGIAAVVLAVVAARRVDINRWFSRAAGHADERVRRSPVRARQMARLDRDLSLDGVASR